MYTLYIHIFLAPLEPVECHFVKSLTAQKLIYGFGIGVYNLTLTYKIYILQQLLNPYLIDISLYHNRLRSYF